MVWHPRRFTGWGDKPPTVTPPDAPPSTPLVLDGPFTLERRGVLYFTEGPGISEQNVAVLRNFGHFYVIPKIAGENAVGIQAVGELFTSSTFVNGARGILSASAFGGGSAIAFDTDNVFAIRNAGVIQAVSIGEGGGAAGVEDDEASFANTRTGLVAVWATASGYGAYSEHGMSFYNAGLIQVTAGQAVGVLGATSFVNRGSIVARDVSADGGSIGVYISGFALIYGGTHVYTNSGLIEADTAFSFDLPSHVITINNSGEIIGAVELARNGAATAISNTGSIRGSVSLGNGKDVYNGVGGTLTGAISLGTGVNNVTLGSDGETVLCAQNGGTDTITGGAGDDFVRVSAGNNTIIGGGGVDTVSFVNATTGAVVDLARGVARCNGTDHLWGVVVVVGATWYDNSLTAGVAGAELVAGLARDTLVGARGNDTLVAGFGGDTATGGGGDNVFVYSRFNHTLTITDYCQNGDADTLHIYGYGRARSITQVGADTIIRLGTVDRIDLKNTDAASLDLASIEYFLHGHFPPPAGALPPDPPPSARPTPTHAIVSAMSALAQHGFSSAAHGGMADGRGHTLSLARPQA